MKKRILCVVYFCFILCIGFLLFFYHNYKTQLLYTDNNISQNNSENDFSNTSVVLSKIQGNFGNSDTLQNSINLICREEDGDRNIYLEYTSDEKTITYFVAKTQVLISDSQIYAANIDDDSFDELILCAEVADTGGKGNYISAIYDFSKTNIVELQRFQINRNEPTTGFVAEFDFEEKQMLITNTFVSYKKVISLEDKYSHSFFKENDSSNLTLGFDSFYTFYPQDIDGDNVFEIIGFQYTYLDGHSDGIGEAKTVFKYDFTNNHLKVFEVDFLEY